MLAKRNCYLASKGLSGTKNVTLAKIPWSDMSCLVGYSLLLVSAAVLIRISTVSLTLMEKALNLKSVLKCT